MIYRREHPFSKKEWRRVLNAERQETQTTIGLGTMNPSFLKPQENHHVVLTAESVGSARKIFPFFVIVTLASGQRMNLALYALNEFVSEGWHVHIQMCVPRKRRKRVINAVEKSAWIALVQNHCIRVRHVFCVRNIIPWMSAVKRNDPFSLNHSMEYINH
jgi:hypothetical protein